MPAYLVVGRLPFNASIRDNPSSGLFSSFIVLTLVLASQLSSLLIYDFGSLTITTPCVS